MAVTLTDEQSTALLKIQNWKKQGCPGGVFRLTGYAGTGKTTLLNEAKNLFREPVITTLTGKAASVLRSKGMTDAINIHQLIYNFDGYADKERPLFVNNRNTLALADVIFLDEASTIDKKTASDLLSRKVPVLAVGDPGQLQPVSGVSWFTGTPDAHLDTVTRQAAESPILRAATLIRKGDIQAGLNEIPRKPAKAVPFEELSGYGQILVGVHATRKSVIARYRRARGFPPNTPMEGDRLVCMRNNHAAGLYNGELFLVEKVGAPMGGTIKLVLSPEEGGPSFWSVVSLEGLKGIKPPYDPDIDHFDYSYALTVHKAQGSEWSSVAVRTDWPGEDYQKWIYTAITRAKKQVLVLE